MPSCFCSYELRPTDQRENTIVLFCSPFSTKYLKDFDPLTGVWSDLSSCRLIVLSLTPFWEDSNTPAFGEEVLCRETMPFPQLWHFQSTSVPQPTKILCLEVLLSLAEGGLLASATLKAEGQREWAEGTYGPPASISWPLEGVGPNCLLACF